MSNPAPTMVFQAPDTTSPAQNPTPTPSDAPTTTDTLAVPSPRLQNSNPTTPPSNTDAATADSATAAPASTTSSDEKHADESTTSGSSRESSAASKPLSTKALEDAIAQVVTGATQAAHGYLTRADEYAAQVELWLADEQDVKGVSKPGASILARRGLVVGAGADASDFVALAFAVAGYASKQVNKLFALRKFRAMQAAATHGTAPADAPAS